MKIIAFLLILTVLVSGCISASPAKNISLAEGQFSVITVCEDRIVCYLGKGFYDSMNCFRDSDLVEKYCGENS